MNIDVVALFTVSSAGHCAPGLLTARLRRGPKLLCFVLPIKPLRKSFNVLWISMTFEFIEKEDIERLLESPVDGVLHHRDGGEFRVVPTCDVSGALLYGDFQFVEFQLRVGHLFPPARVALLALAQLLTHHLPVL